MINKTCEKPRLTQPVQLLLISFPILIGCEISSANNQLNSDAPVLQVRVLETYPHDPEAFTQGLEIEGETVYESTGLRGSSTLRRVDLLSGEIEAYQKLHRKYFGEGLTIFEDRVIQLTWQAGVGAVYEKESLQYVKQFGYRGEGWGLANDGKNLFMSDGTSVIRVLDPNDFKVVRRLRVKDGRRSVSKLNELEYIDGHLYANVLGLDRIARIDLSSGTVLAWIDCSSVYPIASRATPEAVLNGIAHDADTGRTFITGKLWPKIYEIKIME